MEAFYFAVKGVFRNKFQVPNLSQNTTNVSFWLPLATFEPRLHWMCGLYLVAVWFPPADEDMPTFKSLEFEFVTQVGYRWS